LDSLHIVFLRVKQGRVVGDLVARLTICPPENDEDALTRWDSHMHLVGSQRGPFRAWVPIKHDLRLLLPKYWQGVNVLYSLDPGGFVPLLKYYREILEFVEDYSLL
jgi:hypothetical protein